MELPTLLNTMTVYSMAHLKGRLFTAGGEILPSSFGLLAACPGTNI
jgi:hypothetical protein